MQKVGLPKIASSGISSMPARDRVGGRHDVACGVEVSLLAEGDDGSPGRSGEATGAAARHGGRGVESTRPVGRGEVLVPPQCTATVEHDRRALEAIAPFYACRRTWT